MTPSDAAAFNQRVFTQVINMARSTERLAVVGQTLVDAQVAYQRFEAVDGRQLDLKGDPTLRALVDLDKWIRRHHRNPTPADVGCYLSHYYAIRAFTEQDKPFGLILEDDTLIAPDFIDVVLPAVIDAGEWDILKLHARHPGPLIVRKIYGQQSALCSFISKHAGGAAYIINRAAAQKMLKHLVPAVRMIDWAHDEGHVMNLRVRTLRPQPVRLQKVASTRETNVPKRTWLERQSDRPLLPRWSLPFRRVADDVHRFVFNLFNDGGLKAMLVGPKRAPPPMPSDA